MNKTITIQATVQVDPETAWNVWNTPKHIEQWMHASDEWECSKAENDLRVGGRFTFTLGAKDKSSSFDLTGVYTTVEPRKLLAFTLDDGRTVATSFAAIDDGTHIVQTFEMEHENSEELQRSGWQATLDNFKVYAERLEQ